MGETAGSGYLNRVEASIVGVRAVPNAVFIRLTRSFEAEGQTTCMFAEMTPGQALRLIAELQDAVRQALAA